MARGTYLGEDISIFLSEEEVLHLGQLNLDWNAQNGKKLNRIPLEIILDVSEGQQLTARIQVEDFDDFPGDLKERITLTFNALTQLDHIFLLPIALMQFLL